MIEDLIECFFIGLKGCMLIVAFFAGIAVALCGLTFVALTVARFL